jgi:GNAT superfamily N-acetyltransferase
MGIEPAADQFKIGDKLIQIRRFTESDSLVELTDLLHRGYRQLLEMGLRYTATYQDEQKTASRIAGKECYVGVLDSKYVASITLDPPGTADGCAYYHRPNVSSFYQFCVDPELRGQGLGRFLIQFVERRAVQLGATEMAIDTAERAHHLISMYKRYGYQPVDRLKWEATNYDSIVLAKSLSPHAKTIKSKRG